ncbi:MAG: ribosome biogenesis factor YjgA [Methylococcales bacterium]
MSQIEEDYQEPPSKSQRKRECHDLVDLGRELVELSADQLTTLPLPERLHEEVILTRSITKRGARKRQLKFLGGLLRDVDMEPIQEGLDRLRSRSIHATREHHQLEQWRDRLVSEGDGALAELIERYPETDRQQLRQLVRSAERETSQGKPPRSSRLIYQYLKGLIVENQEENLI